MQKWEIKLQSLWYGKDKHSIWLKILYPLSVLFFALSSLRVFLFRVGIFQSGSVPVPVIVVGNITVGGTGKTPVVIALVEYLKEKGLKPGVISRGYGGHAEAYPMLVNSQSSVSESGDEPYLIFKRTSVPVMVDPKRIRAARLLVFDARCDVIISDDGLQHHAMQRDMEIILVDAKRGFGNKRLLPMGPLREPLRRLKHCDWILLSCGLNEHCDEAVRQSGVGEDLPDSDERLASVFLQPDTIQSLPATRFDSIPVKGDTVHAVAGIGNPQRFFESLETLGYKVIPHVFADHYRFRQSDLQFDDHFPVLMTEKDAVKCAHFELENLWYLPIRATLSDNLLRSVNQLLNL